MVTRTDFWLVTWYTAHMRELSQTTGARDTRAWRERQKRGEWVARVRFNQLLFDALRNAGLLYTSARDNASIERAVYDLISIAKQIGLKRSANRRTFEYECMHTMRR